jgi:hypothetical protein
MFENLLARVGVALNDAALPYMIIGGQAVLLYGEPRLTKDIDITLGVGLERLPEVLDATRAAGLRPLVDPETFTKQTMVLPCGDPESGVRVDLIFSFSPYEQLAISRARTVTIGKADLRFASVEDLVIHKLIAGRARDIEDVKSVLLRNPAVDLADIRHWLGEFAQATGEGYPDRLDQILKEIG